MTTKKRIALVTGASAGLGEAFARELAARGHDLVLTARREARLKSLAEQLERAHGIKALVVAMDLADPQTPARLFEHVTDGGFAIDILVNNAGYGHPGHFLHSTWIEHQRFLQVMMMAVTELTHHVLPGMVQRGYGRVLNVSSLAGLIPGAAGHTLYGPIKSYLVKLSEALSAELESQGVHVTASCPGFTYTEFHDVLGNRDQVSKLPSHYWMRAELVARLSLDANERGEPVFVPGAFNKTVAALSKYLPDPLGRRLVKSQSKKIRKQKDN